MYLLDTSVFSQPLRRNPVESTLQRWQEAGDSSCCVSAVSIGEVEWGLHAEDRPARWSKYRALLENRLKVVETTSETWRLFGRLKARQQTLGEPVSDLDLLIAAAAKQTNRTVATLNRRDFSRIESISWEDWSQ